MDQHEAKDITEAIHRLELKVTEAITSHTKTLDEHCDKLDVVFEQIKGNQRVLYGIGQEGPGLVTRVTVLEQSQGKRDVAVAGSYTGVLGWVVKLWQDLML